MTTIDLHIHSTKSDGSLTPFEILDEANRNGVKFLAISDHDTIAAYNDELFEYADKLGIKLIPGVEVSTRYNRKGFHVLGYNFDTKNKDFCNFLEKVRSSRKKYLIEVNEKLNELGFVLNFEKLSKVESVTKANIALDIVTNPANKQRLEEIFGEVPTRGVFIESILIEGCPAYVRKESILPEEAGEAIRKAGGKVVLAHPVVYDRKDNVPVEMIEEVVSNLKPDGIEANYLYFDKLNNMFDDIAFWRDFADKHGLFATIGSDFHLDDGVRAKIGFANQNLSLNEEETKNILNCLGISQKSVFENCDKSDKSFE